MLNSSLKKRLVNAGLIYGDKIVYCDIDGTLYRDSMFLEMFKFLATDFYIDRESILEYNTAVESRKNREIKYPDLIKKVEDMVMKSFKKGHIPLDVLDTIGERIVQHKGKHIIQYTLNKINKLKEDGYKVILISEAPQRIVDKVVDYYGFTTGLGTFYNINSEGFMIGEIEEETTDKKLLLDNINLSYKISDSIAFGDSLNDLPLIDGTPRSYAINPTFELFDKIKNNENTIVVIERKDLVIELTKEEREGITYLEETNK